METRKIKARITRIECVGSDTKTVDSPPLKITIGGKEIICGPGIRIIPHTVIMHLLSEEGERFSITAPCDDEKAEALHDLFESGKYFEMEIDVNADDKQIQPTPPLASPKAGVPGKG
jgi:hypothetical protein